MLWRNSYRVPLRPGNAWWNEMRRLNRHMDYGFGGTRGPIGREYPLLNAWAGDDGLLVVAAVPGIAEEDLDISLDGRTLTISGTRPVDELPEGARQYRQERVSGNFNRTVELPFDVDIDAVKATYAAGTLEINLPRLPEEKPRKITLNAS